jgi:adenine/guanine/hypoxanthine permease
MKTSKTSSSGLLEKTFKLRQHNTNIRTEVLAGFTTFMTMAYIIIVNPNILSATGMDPGALITATCLAAGFSTILMAFLANYPFALAPGMGLNAFFAFSVVLTMGYSWQLALTAVFIEGIIFILLSLFRIREKIIDAIPMNLKYAISVGIGLFIAFIGFANVGIVKAGGAIVELGSLKDPMVVLALAGLLITGFLLVKKIKGALFIGILATTVIGMVTGLVDIPSKLMQTPPSISEIALAPFKVELSELLSWEFVSIIVAFLLVDLFDTLGTLIGVASKANMLDKNGKLPKAKQALLVDAIGTTFGALVGTSTVTTYVESASGVAEGGKTGLTALTTGLLFLVALVFSPIFLIIPSAATAPALILVGLFMMEPVLKINFTDYTEAIPAFLAILVMPIAYSISDGIAFGFVAYVLLKTLSGKFKDVSWLSYIITAVFVIKYLIK